jgi:pimeloyl-ACP methyl ester carboxylesterase
MNAQLQQASSLTQAERKQDLVLLHGGAVATALAGRYPERVSTLVSVATNPCFVSRTSWPAAMPVAALDQFSAQLQNSFDNVEIWQAAGCGHAPQSFGRAHRYDQAAGLQRDTGEELLKLLPSSQQSRVDTVQQLARELHDIGAHNVNSGRQLGLTGRQHWRNLGEAYSQLHDTEVGLPVSWQLCFLKVQKIAEV